MIEFKKMSERPQELKVLMLRLGTYDEETYDEGTYHCVVDQFGDIVNVYCDDETRIARLKRSMSNVLKMMEVVNGTDKDPATGEAYELKEPPMEFLYMADFHRKDGTVDKNRYGLIQTAIIG